MITIHAYRSWREDSPEGYHQRGQHGTKAPDSDRAKQRARLAKASPASFDTTHHELIIDLIEDILDRRTIRLHAISITATHLHMIASWFGGEPLFRGVEHDFKQAQHLAHKTKNILSTLLSKQAEQPGTRWFSRGAGCTAVTDRDHLNHLIQIYLPKHAEEGGMVRVYDRGDTT